MQNLLIIFTIVICLGGCATTSPTPPSWNKDLSKEEIPINTHEEINEFSNKNKTELKK